VKLCCVIGEVPPGPTGPDIILIVTIVAAIVGGAIVIAVVAVCIYACVTLLQGGASQTPAIGAPAIVSARKTIGYRGKNSQDICPKCGLVKPSGGFLYPFHAHAVIGNGFPYYPRPCYNVPVRGYSYHYPENCLVSSSER